MLASCLPLSSHVDFARGSKAQQVSCHTACMDCKKGVNQLSLSLFVRKCTNISKKKYIYISICIHVCIVHEMCFKLPTVQLPPSQQWNKASLPDVYQPKPRTPRFFPGQSSTYNLYSRKLIIFHEKKKNNTLHTQLNTQNRKKHVHLRSCYDSLHWQHHPRIDLITSIYLVYLQAKYFYNHV